MSRSERGLQISALVAVLATVLHLGDHVRRGGTAILTSQVVWGGTVLNVVLAVAVILVLLRVALAPLVAGVVGLASAAAVIAAHVFPYWGSFSDPFIGRVDPISWASLLFLIAAYLVFAAAGFTVLARAGTTASSMAHRGA